MRNTFFILEKLENKKFPYKLTIIQGEKVLLSLRVQEKWPGQKGHIFCIREKENIIPEPTKIIEKVPILYMERLGKRLVIILDREIRKRCDFLFLKKKYKTKPGEYEQIFWRTEQGLKQNKPRVKLTTYYHKTLSIVIDSNEKYPWRFPESIISKRKLPVGDYALIDNDEIISIVERKTFENLLKEFSQMAFFHQHLVNLKGFKNPALVIEANYSDFLNIDKIGKYYTPSFFEKAIAELFAYHSELTIVFAGNRKLANQWTYRYFEAIKSHKEDTPHFKIAEIIEEYKTSKKGNDIYLQIKKAIDNDFPDGFKFAQLKEKFPHISESKMRKILNYLRDEKIITLIKKGNKSFWKRIKEE
ncbi:ERCC4 domain-containing protein [Marinitoga aeolica]|uniref:ERCC4 domain-containing protein n=1 Tax=Marinitoga aeolica TaxID=2809031 RepID=A0ABY8PQZ3_9BACT|nr:ERCC4 domain-containing protein [Marinitoga aeolica]WGS65043.1 ERCC4 domain-containing protein [Marinitoga aeolica]